ncbi:MAG: response regulator transcription factor [Pseudomonadota bacterium]
MAGKPIVIADDHPLFRAALRQAVGAAASGRDVKEASSLAAAKDLIEEAPPGLLCLDLHMDDSQGFAGLIELRQAYPALPIVIVSGSEDADVVRRALKFGASAFVPKSLDVPRIREAIAAVLDGDMWAPNGALDAVDADEDEASDRLASLTPTQLRVLVLVQRGLLNKQIAYELSISEATVKAHMTAIMRKLNVQTRTQAVLAAGALIVEQDAPDDRA